MVQFYSRYKKSNNKYRLLLNSKKYSSYTRIIRPYNIRDIINNNFDKIEKKRKALKNRIYKMEKKEELTRSRRKRFRI